jgi:serine/threonine protein kinase
VDTSELVGRSFGGFEVVERIATGGFGEVFRARQASLGRDAVIKVLKQPSDSIGERFTEEARLASRLDHPNAAHISAFGAEPTLPGGSPGSLLRGDVTQTPGPRGAG